VRWDQLVTVGTPLQFEQTGHHDTQNLAPNWMRARDAEAKDVQNYQELLAKERSETERMFFLRVLARKGAENRRRSTAGRRAGRLVHRRPSPWEKSHTPQPKGARLRIFVVGI
jgi:hypothetical protein